MRAILGPICALLLLVACEQPKLAESQSIVVYFEENSATVDDDAAKVIEQAVRFAKASPKANVTIQGYAAADWGKQAYNMSLSQARAAAVADSMVKAGIARERIRIDPQGATPFGMVPLESRRVEITISE